MWSNVWYLGEYKGQSESEDICFCVNHEWWGSKSIDRRYGANLVKIWWTENAEQYENTKVREREEVMRTFTPW